MWILALPHVFDYHGIKVHIVVCEGLVCIDPQDTLKCLGFTDADSNPEQMIKKVFSMRGTSKGLAFADWVQNVVYPAMQKS